MSRHPKGPRLYLRAGRTHAATGKTVPDVWVVRDGQTQIGTGCGPERLDDAEKALAAYIAHKWAPEARTDPNNPNDPASVYIAEVVAFYLKKKAPSAPNPGSVAALFKVLLPFWSDKTVADVRRSTCEAYVAHRETQPILSYKDAKTAPRVTKEAARRELEGLSAAIGYWDGEHPLTRRPKVSLPEKRESTRDALTRSQAAALLKASLGWRKQADGTWKRLQLSSRANRAHVRRFILIALYTGTRPGVIPKLLWHESPTQAWVDLDDGVIYRRGKQEKDHRTKRRPLVRVPDRLLAHMRRWSEADAGLQAERRAAQKAAGDEPTFTLSTVIHHGGRPFAGRLRRAFDSCVADAGLPEGVTPHWMRHTCATWLMEAAVPLWDAAGYTGMTQATLEKCYGHHRPDHQSKARNALRTRGNNR